MSRPPIRPPFIDAVHAAEQLHLPVERVLDLVGEGKLERLGGKPGNPFVRTAHVDALARELGVDVDEPPRRQKSVTARVQQRITADARWSDVSIEDIEEWVRRAEPERRQAARSAALSARQRLEHLLGAIDAASDGGG